MPDPISIEKNLAHIKDLIALYEKKYGREPGSVKLLAASKHQPLTKLQAAFLAGQTVFGESYLQEALEKIAVLPPAAEWHFIGPIQRNKTRKIAQHFSWIHSVDNEIVVQRLSEQRPANLPDLNICIQLNISQEQSKSGVMLSEAFQLLSFASQLPRLKVRGLMAIPAPAATFATQRQVFHQIQLEFKRLKTQIHTLDTLSMGMSDDFEAAIAEGSTIVRIGTAIFGERQIQKSSI